MKLKLKLEIYTYNEQEIFATKSPDTIQTLKTNQGTW